MSSADDESEGEEFTLWDIKDNLETEPCEVILKGGSPWGFTLTGGAEVRTPIQISDIAPNGKAEDSDKLHVGDYLLGVNGIKCVSQTEAVELIKGAFRTLTLTIWRGTSKLESSVKVLRSSSFLQKAREAQERERTRLGVQDDTIVHRDASMKQRPRRVESFHGSRNRRQETSSGTSNRRQEISGSSNRRPETSSGSSTDRSIQSYHTADSKDVIGGATIQDEKGNNPLPMEQATTPTAKVKEWPTVADLSQPKPILPNRYDGNHGYVNPLLSPSKSSPSLADKEEPYSAKNYSSPLMNKSSPNIHDDVKKSSVHTSLSYSSNQKWPSPNAYQRNSPRQYHSNFYPASAPYIKHNSNDYQNLQEIQQNIASTRATNYSLPPPIEKEECEPELQGLTKGDERPLCSPPAPPTRDISSLKYVPLSQQSHAKYPSWPVTQPSAEIESNESINAPLSVYNETNTSQNNVRALKDRNSPNSDRKASDRNASDPGFKKPIPFSVFLKRPDKKLAPYGTKDEPDKKETEAKMNEFFDSQPGYQQPIFDQDGHRIGDEKYNVSPPERESDGRFPSQQSVDPYENRYLSQQYRGYQDPKARISRDSGSNPLISPDKDSKPLFTDTKYSVADSLMSDNRYTDSSTSPLQSPKDHLPDNVHKSHYDPKSSYIVKKTMLCYTTGTQTEFNSPKKISPTSPRYNTRFQFDKSHQASQTSPESTNRDDDRRWKNERPKSTSEKDKILLNNINSELDSNDQHSAPFMRKLARDLLANQSQESMNKRRSTSSSGGSGLRSPSSDYSHYFGDLKESGSYSSVVIHDDISESDSAFSRPDGTYDSDKQHLHQFESSKAKNARRSLDPSMFTPKYNRNLQNSRYGSEAHLLSHSNKDHTSSMVNLPRSTRDETRARMSRPSTDSSTHSHRTGSSTDTFSSTGTHYSFDAPTSPYVPNSPGQHSSRRESSDSVFSDVDKSPLEKKGDNFKDFKISSADKRQKAPSWVGRTQSMKKAYGTYDEMHHVHKRQESDVSSASSGEQFIHSRSQSENNYLPMEAIRLKQPSEKTLGSINEESSESRWQDALRRSQRSSQSSFDQNYTDLDVKKHVNEKLREYQSKTEMERSNLKRTSSEQFRPIKDRLGNKTNSEPRSDDAKQQILPNKMIRTNSREKLSQSPTQSPSDLRQSGSESKRMISPSSSRTDLRHSGSESKRMISPSSSRTDLRHPGSESKRMISPSNSRTDLRQPGSDSKQLTSPSSSRTDLRSDSSDTRSDKKSSPTQSRSELYGSREDLKRVQKHALQNFMLTKTGRLPSDEEEQQSNGNTQQNNGNTHHNNGNTHHNNGNVAEPQVKPERPNRISVTESFRKKYAEGDKLRRSRSISSTDSGNYTEMRPPIRPQQTEWSRVRSQIRRPLSVGSDSGSSLVDPYAVTPITSLDHQRTPSDTIENVPQSPRAEQSPRNLPTSQSEDIQSPRMGSSSIYQNLVPEHTGYRKPPAPPPPIEDDKPPELPPRNYRHKEASQSDSQLIVPPPRQHQYQQPVEESHEKYVEQLRKFSSRRYSEQQQAASMMYLSSKTQTHLSQSYPKPEVKSLEATSPMTSHSPSSSISLTPPFTSQQPSYAANFTQSQPKNVSPKSSNHQSPSSSSFELDNDKNSESRHPQPAPRQSPPPRPPHPSHLQTPPRHPQSNQQQTPPRPEQPPSLQHQLSSPEPPPPPTPMKDVDFDQELPPPPPEVIEESERFSDDSYLAHKTKGDTRQIGTYKRSSTTGDVSSLSSETNNNKVIEKPPRKRLQKAWQPPTSQSESSGNEQKACQPPTSQSESSGNEQDLDHGPVPRFSARETQVNPMVVKSVARPLEKNHIQQRPLGSSYSTSALLTPRPFTSTSEKENQSRSAERPSVRDLKSCYENKSTPPRQQDRFTSPKLVPRSLNNINNSPANKDLPNGLDSTDRLSNENFQQSDSVHDVLSESDPSPRRTSLPPERTNKVHYGGHSQTKNVSNFSDEIQSPLQDNSSNSSYSVEPHHVSDNNRSLYSRKSFNSSRPDYSKNQTSSSYSARDQANSTNVRQRSQEEITQSSHVRQRSQEEITPSCHVRQRSQEELECDEKVSEIVKQDKSLIQVLQVDNKGRMDFMNGLFPLDEPVRYHHSPQSSNVIEDKPTEKEEPKSPIDPSSLPADYFKSSPKAKIEMDMRGKSEEINQEFSKDIQDPDSLLKTKEELVKSIQKKVEKLKEGKAELQKELDEVDDVRHRLEDIVQKKCRTQQEKDKFTSYVTDMEKIIKLLLKLSGLLARAENALQSLPENSSPSVKKLAIDKRDRLQDQHEEAKSLKDDIDKRSAQVDSFLQDCLTEAEYEDYKYFVQMKSKLTIEMQEFEDKITLGQEQILGLKRNIPGK